MNEFVCDDCGRRQLARTPHLPQGLDLEEVRIIGWTNIPRGTGWKCPLCSPGGEKKLRRVFEAGKRDIIGSRR